MLELIGNEFMTAQGPPVWPGRAILAWSDGVAPPTIARELGLDEQTVRALRHRWLSATARIATAERKLNKAFADLVNLVFDLLTGKTTPEGAPTPSVDLASRTSSERPATAKELRPAAKALIEILHHKPAAYGINRSNWTLQSLADIIEAVFSAMKPCNPRFGLPIRRRNEKCDIHMFYRKECLL